MRIKYQAKKAIMLGGLCSISYLAVYLTRNILGTVSPQMIEKGVFTTAQVGTLSSVYFITYAVGQLINGIIGDKIKGKYMISFGLILSGICNIVFSLVSATPLLSYIAYGLTGFSLSMIYGPLIKVVSENTEPIYAERCSIGFTFSSFFGSPLAGILAAFLVWQGVFAASSVILILIGLLIFTVFHIFEKRGIIEYGKYEKPPKSVGGIKTLIKNQIIKFTIISIITGVVRTTVVFWLPTYISQHLNFLPEESAMIFTVATFVISLTAFIAVFIYERLHRNMHLTILLSFISASAMFLAVYFVKLPILNIIFLVLAIMSSNCAASILWSMYCPSLRDTGMVSAATGFLDFVSYISAAVSSSLFANAASTLGWGKLILIWFSLMILGVIISLPYNKIKKQTNIEVE